eukprot:scaffold1151_cov126-Isochrysis_galbana.AAC.5
MASSHHHRNPLAGCPPHPAPPNIGDLSPVASPPGRRRHRTHAVRIAQGPPPPTSQSLFVRALRSPLLNKAAPKAPK